MRYYTIPLALLLIVGLVSGVAVVSAQDDQPGEPVQFWGDIEDDDGIPAPDGTTIVAVVDGDVEDEITVDTTGAYGDEDAFGEKLTINEDAGEEVSFHIDSPDGSEAIDGSPHNLESGVFEHDLVFPEGEFEEDGSDDNGSGDDDSDDSGSGNGDTGGQAGGAPATGDDTADTEETDDTDTVDDEEVTIDDVSETVDEVEPDGEATIEVGDDTDGEGVTVDTSEETDSVDEVSFEDDSVQSVSVEEYSENTEVIETTAASIEQAATEDTDSESGSVSVSTVSRITVEGDDGDDTPASVTMRTDADNINDPEQTSIYHETDDGWEELPTEVEEETDEEITFSGETGGFSLFAVAETEDEDESTDQDEEDAEPTEEPEETDDSIPGFGISVALLAVIALALFARRLPH